MNSFIKYIESIQDELVETYSGDVAPVTSKMNKKAQCRKTKKFKKVKTDVLEALNTPEEVLIKNNIKVKSSDMDDDSYVIILYKKDDLNKATNILEKQGFEVNIVGKLLYIS